MNHCSSNAVIIGLDPGTQTLGVSALFFDYKTLQPLSLEVHTLVGTSYDYDESLLRTHGERFAKLNGHRQSLYDLFSYYNPCAVACESPFYNRLRPNAFEALITVRECIRTALIDYNRWIKLEMVDPPTVKKAIGVKGNGDKDVVKEAFLKSDLYKIVVNKQDLSEHNIDSSCVAYWKLKSLLA